MNEKIEAAIAVLNKRADAVIDILYSRPKKYVFREYYEGKLEGYNQAIDLLKSSLESISVEL